jgi:MFS family permease
VTQPFALLLPQAHDDWRLALFVVGWFALGYGGTLYNVVQVSFRQAVCPDRLLGRVQASNRFFAWGSLPLGGLLGGGLGTWLGARGTLLVAAIGLIGSVLWLLLSPLPRLGRDDAPPPGQLATHRNPTPYRCHHGPPPSTSDTQRLGTADPNTRSPIFARGDGDTT